VYFTLADGSFDHRSIWAVASIDYILLCAQSCKSLTLNIRKHKCKRKSNHIN